jgi:hypothetical protein
MATMYFLLLCRQTDYSIVFMVCFCSFYYNAAAVLLPPCVSIHPTSSIPGKKKRINSCYCTYLMAQKLFNWLKIKHFIFLIGQKERYSITHNFFYMHMTTKHARKACQQKQLDETF